MFRVCVVVTLLSSVLLPSQADELADLTKRVAALEGDFNSLESKINDNASQIADLSALVNNAFTKLADQDAKQLSILDAISATDENGEIYITLNSIMKKSDTARREVRKAVEQSIRTEGTFSIVNEMGTVQDIVVNHIQHRVQPGATLNLTVPVGTVTTRLPGQELVNWTIGVPNYKQSVSIKPRYTAARVPLGSPSSSQQLYYGGPVYDAPIYVNDPWLGNYFIY